MEPDRCFEMSTEFDVHEFSLVWTIKNANALLFNIDCTHSSGSFETITSRIINRTLTWKLNFINKKDISSENYSIQIDLGPPDLFGGSSRYYNNIIYNVRASVSLLNYKDKTVLLPSKKAYEAQLSKNNSFITLKNCVSKSELKSFIVDDILQIKCKMFLSSCSPIHKRMIPELIEKNLSSDFSSLLLSEEFSDLIIQTSTGDVKAHKNILAARCPVFKTMLTSPMVENAESRIKMPDFSDKIVREMLKFIYSGTISLEGEVDDIEPLFELYKISHKYQLEVLRNHCFKLIDYNLGPYNALEVFMFANSYDDKILKVRACEMIKNEMEVFVTTPEFEIYQHHILAQIFSTMSEI